MKVLKLAPEYKYINKWTLPDSYMGATWYDYFEVFGQNRDSDTLTRSNFQCFLEKLGGESETIIINHCKHWACGWVETIMIHESDLKALSIAESIMRHCGSYPVIDEFHWSELEHEEHYAFAESEADSLSEFLIEVFSIPETMTESLREVAIELNMKAQREGENSCFNFNLYHYNKTKEYDTEELKYYLNDFDLYFNENEAYKYLISKVG